MDLRERLARCVGFQWDEGNLGKNWDKHQVYFWQAEEIFLNLPLVVEPSPYETLSEDRYYALGKTDAGRFLFVVFTFRGQCIRIISARDMSRKERRAYERHEEKINSAL